MEMNTYQIEIIETLVKIVAVSAVSEDEALSIVINDYKNEKHVLDESNHISTNFEIIK